jgi:hypothetical protein
MSKDKRTKVEPEESKTKAEVQMKDENAKMSKITSGKKGKEAEEGSASRSARGPVKKLPESKMTKTISPDSGPVQFDGKHH